MTGALDTPDFNSLQSGTPGKPEYLRPYEADKENFLLGGNANYANQFERGARARGEQASGTQNLIRGDANLADYTNRMRSAEAYNRANPASGALQQSVTTGGYQGALADRLNQFARAPEGPSAAQAQLQSGTNQALASQLAMARSGGGMGESAQSLARAGQNAAGLTANAATSAAQLRADEYARNRDRALQAYQASGDVLSQQRQGTQGEAGIQLDAQKARDEAALGYSAEARASNQQESDAALRGAQTELDAMRLGLEGQQGALAGRSKYEDALLQRYQTEQELKFKERELAHKKDQDTWNTVLGIGTAIGNLSDIRAKKNIEPVDSDFSGVGKYEYEYKNPARHGDGRYQGPMAHELRGIPGVVQETPEGDMVDTSRLSLSTASEVGDLRRELEMLKASKGDEMRQWNEQTRLSPKGEAGYREWVKRNGIRDSEDPRARYDYRGFYDETGGSDVRPGDHFPDTYKQHGHPTFSDESKYSDDPLESRWLGEEYADLGPQRRALSGPSAVDRAYHRRRY